TSALSATASCQPSNLRWAGWSPCKHQRFRGPEGSLSKMLVCLDRLLLTIATSTAASPRPVRAISGAAPMRVATVGPSTPSTSATWMSASASGERWVTEPSFSTTALTPLVETTTAGRPCSTARNWARGKGWPVGPGGPARPAAVVLADAAAAAGGAHHGGAPVFDGTELGDGHLLVGLAGEVVVGVVGGAHDDPSALGHGITDRFVEGNVETDTERQGGVVHVHRPRFGAGQGVGADLLQTLHELGEDVSVGDVFTEGDEVALVVMLTGSGVGVPHHALHVTGPVVVEAAQPPQQRNPDVLGGPGDDLLGHLVTERVDVAGVLGKQHHVGPRLLPGAYGLGEFVDTVGVIVENLHAFAEDRHFPDVGDVALHHAHGDGLGGCGTSDLGSERAPDHDRGAHDQPRTGPCQVPTSGLDRTQHAPQQEAPGEGDREGDQRRGAQRGVAGKECVGLGE